MLKPTISLVGVLQSGVGKKQTKNGKNERYFTLISETEQYLVLAFDDEGNSMAYRRLEQMKLKEGALVQIIGTLAFRKQYCVPNEVWNKMFPGQENNSLTYFPMVKLSMIDYAIPIDYEVKKEKKEEKTEPVNIRPLSDFSSFEKGGK